MPPMPDSTPPDLRVNASADILGLLREIQDKGLRLTLAASDGRSYNTTLWTIDAEQQTLSFSADARDPQLRALLEAEDVIAVAFLDRIKVQFQLDNLLLVNSMQGSALRTDLPREMFRFQRRDTFRVRPLDSGTPRVTLAHPQTPERKLQLRIFDVSMGGLALVLPQETAPEADFPAGTVLSHVEVQLERGTQLEVRLRVQHVTQLNAESAGVQLGCAFESLSAVATGILQRYIDHTQKRQRMLQKR